MTNIYHAYGQDTNWDLAGPHHRPDLGIYQGLRSDVLEFVMNKYPNESITLELYQVPEIINVPSKSIRNAQLIIKNKQRLNDFKKKLKTLNFDIDNQV